MMFDKPTRNHISIILERLGATFFLILVFGAQAFLEKMPMLIKKEFWLSLPEMIKNTESRTMLIGMAAFILLVVAVLLISFFFWRKTFFYIDGDNLIYEKRTIFRHSANLPIKNISTVNLERNIFERIVGTAKVKIDLNSSATADKTDFTFILSEPIAKQLQDLLTAHRNALILQNSNASTFTTSSQDNAEEIISFSPAQVVRHTLLSLPVAQGILTFLFVFVIPSISTDEVSFSDLLPTALIAVIGGLGYAAIKILNLLDYTVKRDKDNIYISCGKLKKTNYSFNICRINAVFLRQPFLARIMGLYALEVAVVGMGNEKNEKPMLTLLVNKKELERIFKECIPDYTCQGEIMRQNKCVLISLLIKVLIVAALAVPFALLALWIIPAALAIALLITGLLSWKTKTLASDDKVFHYSRGVFSKVTSMFKYSDIQETSISTGPISRIFNAGKMTVHILSSSTHQSHTTGAFTTDSLYKISRRMVEHRDSSATLWE